VGEYIEVTPDLLAGFLDEARQYVDTLNSDLMEFENEAGEGVASLEGAAQRERMNEMFRAAHSLKGLSATLNFSKVNRLTHRMETFFDEVRNGRRQLDGRAIEVLYGVFDTLEELVNAIAEGSEEGVAIEESLSALDALLSSPASAGGAQTGAGPERAPSAKADSGCSGNAASESADAEQAADVPEDLLEDPELRKLFLDSTAEEIDALNERLLELEKQPDSQEIVNEIFRRAHTIKGAAGAAGLADMSAMAHEMESVLAGLRDGSRSLDESVMNALFKAADWLRGALQDLQQGTRRAERERAVRRLFASWVNGQAGSLVGKSAPDGDHADRAASGSASLAGPGPGQCAVEITFPPGNAESDIQAFLIYNKLREAGEIVACDPDMTDVEAGQDIKHLRVVLAGDVSASQVESLVRMFDVSDVKVETGPETPTRGAAGEAVGADPSARSSAGEPGAGRSAARAGRKTASQGSARNEPAKTVSAAGALRSGQTLRVDVERLDGLMNLGGELVINRAMFAQLHSSFQRTLDGANLSHVVHELKRQVDTVLRDVSGEGAARPVCRRHLAAIARQVDELAELMEQVQQSRALVNQLGEAVDALGRISDGLQTQIMETRMVPIGPLFTRFRRVVRDLAKGRDKDIELVLRGETTELDKKMIDELGDPLTHLIRNAADHGIEGPQERLAAGKSRTGTIVLEAYHRGNSICIEVRDDGARDRRPGGAGQGARARAGHGRPGRADVGPRGDPVHLPSRFLDGQAGHRRLRPGDGDGHRQDQDRGAQRNGGGR